MPLDLGMMIMSLLGGLALFLTGMEQMSSALKAIAGDGLRKLLANLTKNRFLGVITGAVTTAVVQSSSVTTVLVVGFISAGLMTLTQSVGVIMGANIGTTITAQIVAFNVTKYALGMVAIGFAVSFAGKREKLKKTGVALMGLGLIFFGMELMSNAASPLRDYQPFIDTMARMDNPLLGILVAASFTALVQSSSATTGIVIVLSLDGFISLEAGIALAMGANLGTCVTAALAAIGKAVEAKRAAAVHVLFNVFGVIIWIGFIGPLADWVQAISPTYPELEGRARLAQEVPRQIANAYTLFNVANTVLLIGVAPWLVRVSGFLIREQGGKKAYAAKPRYLDSAMLETPLIAVDHVRQEVGHLGELVLSMLEIPKDGEVRMSGHDGARLRQRSEDVEVLSSEILRYVRKLYGRDPGPEGVEKLERLLDVVNQLRGMSETVVNNLGALVSEWQELHLEASDSTRGMMRSVHVEVTESVREIVSAVQKEDAAMAQKVIGRKDALYKRIDSVNTHLGARLQSDEPNRIETYLLESRVLEIERRIYYFAKRIGKTLVSEED